MIMDKDHGNLIKVDRFGLVKRAMHGTKMLNWQARPRPGSGWHQLPVGARGCVEAVLFV